MKAIKYLLGSSLLFFNSYALAESSVALKPTPTPAMSPSPTPTATPCGCITSDAEVASAVNSQETSEIEMSKIALYSYYDRQAEIRHFAEQVISDDTLFKQNFNSTLKKEGIPPVETDLSRALLKQSEETVSHLTRLSNADFYATYLDLEINEQESFLSKLKEEWIPKSEDPAIKSLLSDLIPLVQKHISEAQTLKGELKH